MVAVDGRQRWVVAFVEGDMPAEPALGRQPDPRQHLVDIDRGALRRRAVGKHLHAVDQGADAVGFVAYQLGQGLVVRRRVLLQELRRAADARQRALDLMRQHRRHRGHRARGAAMHQLTIDPVGDGLFLQAQHHHVGGGRERCRTDGKMPNPEPRRVDDDAVLGDAGAVGEGVPDQPEDRAVGRDQGVQVLILQPTGAGTEELLGRGIDESDRMVAADRQHRVRKRIQHRAGLRRQRWVARNGLARFLSMLESCTFIMHNSPLRVPRQWSRGAP